MVYTFILNVKIRGNCVIITEYFIQKRRKHSDTGLLLSALDEEAQEDFRVNKNLLVYKGALYDNFVAEVFVK